MSVEKPFRCPKCDHVVKYLNEAESHCPGCGRALRLLNLVRVPQYDSATQCLKCWELGSTKGDYVLLQKKPSIEQFFDGDYWKVKYETEMLQCPSCGALQTGVKREVSREHDEAAVRAAEIYYQERLKEEERNRVNREILERARQKEKVIRPLPGWLKGLGKFFFWIWIFPCILLALLWALARHFDHPSRDIRGVPSSETFSSTIRPTSGESTYSFVKSGANLRNGPGTQYGSVTTLDRGIRLILLGPSTDDHWERVRLDDGREGFVNRRLLSGVPLASADSFGMAPSPRVGVTQGGGHLSNGRRPARSAAKSPNKSTVTSPSSRSSSGDSDEPPLHGGGNL